MRPDLDIIQQWVKPGDHVLDLGCGDGTLLDFLQRERQATGFGLEINPDHITTCMSKGVAVIEQNLDTQGLDNFDDGMFDIVLMTQALPGGPPPDGSWTRCSGSAAKASSPSPTSPTGDCVGGWP